LTMGDDHGYHGCDGFDHGAWLTMVTLWQGSVPTLLNQCIPYLIILSFYLTLTFNIFRFATQAKNALLFYNGRFNEQHDFLALEIIDEQVQFSFSLGGNITVVNTIHLAMSLTNIWEDLNSRCM
jgi:hypothetical protein